MNRAALDRLAKYSGRPATALIRSFPSINTAEHWPEPTVLIRQHQRTFLRTCPRCEQRAGGVRLIPDRDPLKLACEHHKVWLISAEPVDLHQAPGIFTAVKRLARIRRRRGDAVVRNLYNHLHEYLTNEWRGFGWHRVLVRRWTDRQQEVFGAKNNGDEFVRARTHHWSMLPETVALLGLLANPYWARTLLPQPCHQRLHTAISQVLHLDDYWTFEENLHATITFSPLLSNINDQARIGRLTSDPDWMNPDPTASLHPPPIPTRMLTAEPGQQFRRPRRGRRPRNMANAN
jgi:hypothetical protein